MEVKQIRIVPYTGHIYPVYKAHLYQEYINSCHMEINLIYSAYVVQERVFWGWKQIDLISQDEYMSLLRKNAKDQCIKISIDSNGFKTTSRSTWVNEDHIREILDIYV